MAIPEYNRTVLRQTQETDMSEANVYQALAQTLDNFSSQIGSTTRNLMASEKAKQAAELKANTLATKTYLDGKEADIIEAAHKASINNPTDYQAYLAEFDAQAKIWMDYEGLEGMVGASAGLKRMIDLKRQKYGEKPYEAEQKILKENAYNVAKVNLVADVDDYVYTAGSYIEQFYDMPIDAQMSDTFADYQVETLKQWQKMTAKINDLVTVHDVDPEVALAFEEKMQTKYLVGVVGKQITEEINNNNGVNALSEFYTNPNKFLRDRSYLGALIPEGVKISEELKLSIYDELNGYLGDFDKAAAAKETEEDEALVDSQLETYTALLAGLQTGSDLSESNLYDAWRANDIDDKQYSDLLEAMASDKYFKEDETIKWNLTQEMLNPELSQKDKTALIAEELTNKTISGDSAASYLTKAASASKVTAQPFFSQANSAIAKSFGVSDSGMSLFPSSGISEDDLVRMRFAQEELYRRVEGGEEAIEIYTEIIDKYKAEDDKAEKLPLGSGSNRDWNDSYTTKGGFNTYWVGTKDNVDGYATQLKIGADLDAGIFNEEEAEKLIKDLRAYLMKDMD